MSELELGVRDEAHRRALPRRVVGSLLWLGSASLFGQIVSCLSTLLVIRLLTPSDYGLMAMATLPVGLLMLVRDLGIGTVIVQTPTLDRPQLKALFGACLLAHLLGVVVLFSAAPLVAWFFGEPRVTLLVRVLSLSFVCVGLSALPRALMARNLQFESKAKIDILTALVSALAALVLAVTGWGVWSLVGSALAIRIQSGGLPDRVPVSLPSDSGAPRAARQRALRKLGHPGPDHLVQLHQHRR